MGNGLCPECGCELEIQDREVEIDTETGLDSVIVVRETCPCCAYEEEFIED